LSPSLVPCARAFALALAILILGLAYGLVGPISRHWPADR
jgi:hypothetical protein